MITKTLARPAIRIFNRIMAHNDAKIERGKSLPGGIKEYKDIDYFGDGDRGHLLDVYAREGAKNLPILIDIHGGGLIYGYKELNKRFCYEMARLGFAVVSINYRLVPSVMLADQLRDVTAAFRWVCTHAEQFAATDEIYLTGDSAGAFLALYGAAMTGSASMRSAFDNEGSGLRAKGMFLVSGFYDILDGDIFKFLGSSLLPRDYARLPMYPYLDIRNMLSEYAPPRCFLTSSQEDALATHTENYVKLLDEFGLPYELDFRSRPTRTPGAHKPRKFTHIYPVRNPDWAESADILRRAAAYMREGSGRHGFTSL